MNKNFLLTGLLFIMFFFVSPHLSANTYADNNINSSDSGIYDVLSARLSSVCMVLYNDRQIIRKGKSFKPEIFKNPMKCIDGASLFAYLPTSANSININNSPVKQCLSKEVKGRSAFLMRKTRK